MRKIENPKNIFLITVDNDALPDTVNAPKIGISLRPDSKELKKAVEALLDNKDELREEEALEENMSRKITD